MDATPGRTTLDERFEGDGLDRSVWFPWYLPHWSSRAASAADWTVADGALRLRIGRAHPRWCADLHEGPVRVSCLQTGSSAGPVGSTDGQQPFRDGLTVREEQPPFWGCMPRFGRIEATMRATISPRSMFALWLSGIEDRPERSGEICVAEVFGDAVRDGTAAVGLGLHRFRDPGLQEDFATVTLPIDVAEPHTYAVDWMPGSLRFSVDGAPVRTVAQAPDYPVQLMLGVFDFPGRAGSDADPAADAAAPVVELVVSRVAVRPLDPGSGAP